MGRCPSLPPCAAFFLKDPASSGVFLAATSSYILLVMGKRHKEYEWEVVVIRRKGERLGRVRAPDLKAAYEQAIEKFGYRGDPKRLLAWRVG